MLLQDFLATAAREPLHSHHHITSSACSIPHLALARPPARLPASLSCLPFAIPSPSGPIPIHHHPSHRMTVRPSSLPWPALPSLQLHPPQVAKPVAKIINERRTRTSGNGRAAAARPVPFCRLRLCSPREAQQQHNRATAPKERERSPGTSIVPRAAHAEQAGGRAAISYVVVVAAAATTGQTRADSCGDDECMFIMLGPGFPPKLKNAPPPPRLAIILPREMISPAFVFTLRQTCPLTSLGLSCRDWTKPN